MGRDIEQLNWMSPATKARAEEKLHDLNDTLELRVAERTEASVHRRFAGSVARLRWSDRGLTRLVHDYATGEVEQAGISTPDLCSDIRAWVASGFQTVSVATAAYLGRESTISTRTAGAQEAIMRKLERFESPADKRVARQIAAAEKQATETVLPKLSALFAKVGEVLHGAAAPAS